MAFEQTIIWTPLPNGLDTTRGTTTLFLSVHVAPRLINTPSGADAKIENFPDWVNWPSHAQSFRVTVEILPPGPGAGTYDLPATIAPDIRRSDIWQALFPLGTKVRSRHNVNTFTNIPIISYSPSNVVDFLQKNYVDTALNSPTEHPTYNDLIGWIDPIGFGDAEGHARLQNELNALAAQRSGPRANTFANKDAKRDFVALREFHRPRSSKRVPVNPPVFDLHDAISLAGEHRKLLRLLGLAFDLELDTTALPPLPSSPVKARVSVVPSFPAQTAPGYDRVLPKTRCLLGSSTFEPESTDPGLAGRHLKVGDGNRYDVIQVDQDGGGIKASGLADNLQLSRSFDHKTQDTPERYPLPSLRSGGLAIVKKERGLQFVAALDRSKDINDGITGASSLPDLFGQDLVRGYVLDVLDSASSRWQTVCARTGNYRFPTVASNSNEPATEEAAVDSPPSGPADPADPKKFHLQQSLARWDGWSLAAPRPGLPINSKDDVTPEPVPAPPFPVDFDLQATNLPRLRFGRSYALRMRAVDLSGNAPPLSGTPAVGDSSGRVTAQRPYLRFEPVPSPDVQSRDNPVQGESIHRLVIRGNYNVDAGDAADRFVLPPRASQLLCEQHGLFDVPGPGGTTVVDKNAYALIASHEFAHYDQDQPIDPTAAVPYLPDILARGAAVRVIDGPQAGSVFHDMQFSPASGDAWPDNRPFQLHVVHGDSPGWEQDDSGRVFTVRLTKADVIRIRLSSTLTQADLELLGTHGWVRLAQNPSNAYLEAARNGQHWMTTPYRELVLVYAVRQPLTAPVLSNTGPQRGIGDTFARIEGNLDFDVKSTGKCDMRARWNEPVDGGPGKPPPSGPGAPDTAGRNVEVPAFNMPLDSALTVNHRFAGRHEFGDTKHRKVAYQTFATSRFTDHFVEHLETTPTVGTPIPLSGAGLEPRSLTVTSPDGAARFAEGVDYNLDPPAGTVTFLKDVGPVKIKFFPPVSRATPPLPNVVDGPYTPNVLPILDVPSSARPAAPDIAFVVPIFKWEPVKKTGSKVTSSRSPSALRVYLERPWWTSGVDELLGVVTWPGAETGSSATISKRVAPFVSDWGRDPLFNSPALPSPHPRLNSFPNSPVTLRGAGLTLEEIPGLEVNVAGHPVGYDAARGLWYCDIRLNVGQSYSPIVRLALARYQQHSLPGVELSRVVLADFMQVAPGRAVSITLKKFHGKSYVGSVTLSGRSYTKAAKSVPGPGYARVILEKRDTAIDDAVVGWKQVGSPHAMDDVNLPRGAGKGWVAKNILLPGSGTYRLVVEQYEELPIDKRTKGIQKIVGRRLVFSDVIPLNP